jgi:fatty acid desaturase
MEEFLLMSRSGDGPHRRELPVAANIGLALTHLTVMLYQFLVLPLWLLPRDVAWAWTLLPLAFLSNPFWSLIHECIHDLFHPNPSINAFFGRVAGVLFGAPFRILRLSHLLHHKLNRTPVEATELYDATKISRLRAILGYYCQILGGLYLLEVLSGPLFLLPRAWLRSFAGRFIGAESVSGMLMQAWTRDESIREIRTDAAVILSCLGLSLWCYGENWPLLVGVLAMRGFLISFLDNVYHYHTPVNDILFASNLWLPAPCAKLLLHFNLHGVHHQNPALPWNRLAAVFRDQAAIYHGNYLATAAIQLNGPLELQELGVQGSTVQKFNVPPPTLNR